ncbi:condensin complex protein MksE [Pinibacter soli]|uniref:Chromosome partition protein MukE n=1 Tax=Pinibacter soli TaxID=3044211 RepID=A0ABT6RFR8_9BACT|nr:chromosome partition protein MukE [Pinibacter soli]MDI3321409.1 chromosome partition protein MukE [Pinibacter soli]
MEDNHTGTFDFLNKPQVQKHFAELNIELLKGRHIMQSTPALFALLDEFEKEVGSYYRTLYGLILERRSHDSVSYFYLEFPEAGRGKLSNPLLYDEMDAKTTIVACILANLYFSNYFSYDKKFQWDDIQYEIEHGEHREAYQQLFFNDVRSDYTDKEWEDVQQWFKSVINFFNRIGLVEKEDADDGLQFTIQPTIHHFIEIYKSEIEDIDNFLREIKL